MWLTSMHVTLRKDASENPYHLPGTRKRNFHVSRVDPERSWQVVENTLNTAFPPGRKSGEPQSYYHYTF